MKEQEFMQAGYKVVGTENNENKLLNFLKEHYPSIIKDNEIDLNELKAIAELPIDEKVNGYGLNFVGRNFARAKYAKKTEMELRLNATFSKDIDSTENLVLKGDNLDSLKILKNHYTGQIKCIYIDPPYNTDKDEFVYPDKFDKEEAEVLGLVNLSESDYARMDFSFKTKKSHNGWLAFMYPRLLLARDLLTNDGIIFISIDDNEQANLKLLCDDVFGEENFVGELTWEKKKKGTFLSNSLTNIKESILLYSKNSFCFNGLIGEINTSSETYPCINASNKREIRTIKKGIKSKYRDANYFLKKGSEISDTTMSLVLHSDLKIKDNILEEDLIIEGNWRYTQENMTTYAESDKLYITQDLYIRRIVDEPRNKTIKDLLLREGTNKNLKYSDFNKNNLFEDGWGSNEDAEEELRLLMGKIGVFSNPKPVKLIAKLITSVRDDEMIILDFFAGSGTTGEAVLRLNSLVGGNHKFILCQIDEPIDPVKKKAAYDFCIDNNLPPVISSITIERLKRAGEKIAKDLQAEDRESDLFKEDKKQVPDIGFKVFDSVEAPKLEVDDKGQISISFNESDALSRIYNMIFTVGLDEPTQVPEVVVDNCIYKIGSHYYITNSEKITSDDYSNAIKNGKVFIDGWTASLNGTLQNYKEDVKIVF